jgi:hypothetical protein
MNLKNLRGMPALAAILLTVFTLSLFSLETSAKLNFKAQSLKPTSLLLQLDASNINKKETSSATNLLLQMKTIQEAGKVNNFHTKFYDPRYAYLTGGLNTSFGLDFRVVVDFDNSNPNVQFVDQYDQQIGYTDSRDMYLSTGHMEFITEIDWVYYPTYGYFNFNPISLSFNVTYTVYVTPNGGTRTLAYSASQHHKVDR